MLRNKLYVYGDERLEVPSHLHLGKDILDRMAECGDHLALISADEGETMTFGQLAQKTVDVALSLARIGVRKGDVVSMCSENHLEILSTILGVFCAGGVYSPIDISQGSLALLHRAKIAKPKVIFMSSKAYDLHKKSFDSIGCVETYVIYGNENKDGGVLFKHFLTETADVADFVPAPVDGWKDLAFRYSPVLITDDWCNSYGLEYTLSCLRRGLTIVFTLKTDPHLFLCAVDKYKVKLVQTAPVFVNLMIKSSTLHRYDVTSVQAIMSASTPLIGEQIAAVKKRFQNLLDVYQMYGMSEAGPVCSDVYSPTKHGSVGKPSPGLIIKVVNIETRELLGPNQRGEICIKSPTLMHGYIGVANTDHLDSEGFYKTGDVGYYDENRYFYVVNRIKDLIKYNDISVAPPELEAVLLKDPRVRDAGVAATGGRIAALVVRQPHADATPQELLDYLHDNISCHVRVEGGVHFVAALPRGAGGKLDRTALRQMLHQQLDDKTTNAKQFNELDCNIYSYD